MDSVVNMRYFIQTMNGIIISFGEGSGGEEITAKEYEAIRNAVNNKPQPTDTTDYMLRSDLTWEAYTIEPVDPDESAEIEDYQSALEDLGVNLNEKE